MTVVEAAASLTPILATDDPLAAAEEFQAAGWQLEFKVGGRDPIACVSLDGGARVMLGSSGSRFLPVEARAHRGAGVVFNILVGDGAIERIHAAHSACGCAGELTDRLHGQRAFNATLCGYRFLIGARTLSV